MKIYSLTTILLQATGSFKTQVQSIVDNYLLPIYMLIVLMGAITGILKNWENINDSSGSGRRKEGLINVAYIIGYAALGGAILAAVVAVAKSSTIKL